MNAPGDFYVVRDACITCGAPEDAAPTLIRFVEDAAGGQHCVFLKQPQSPEETSEAIDAVHVSCCDGLRYAGTDREILRRLKNLGKARQCDQ